MHRLGRYKDSDIMSDLINDNYQVLLVLSRFGISLGFADKSIGEVCRLNNVDTDTFLAVVNLFMDEESFEPSLESFSLRAMMDYLHSSHDYYLNFRLPAIRNSLTKAMFDVSEDVAKAMTRFFDDYCSEVRKHMEYEEQNVFPYVRNLLENRRSEEYSIDLFSKQHDKIESKLTELKNIIIKYYPGAGGNELNGVLFDIFLCEQDLASHNKVEDLLFVPAIKKLEVE